MAEQVVAVLDARPRHDVARPTTAGPRPRTPPAAPGRRPARSGGCPPPGWPGAGPRPAASGPRRPGCTRGRRCSSCGRAGRRRTSRPRPGRSAAAARPRRGPRPVTVSLDDVELQAPRARDGQRHGGHRERDVVGVEERPAADVPLAQHAVGEPGAAGGVGDRPPRAARPRAAAAGRPASARRRRRATPARRRRSLTGAASTSTVATPAPPAGHGERLARDDDGHLAVRHPSPRHDHVQTASAPRRPPAAPVRSGR